MQMKTFEFLYISVRGDFRVSGVAKKRAEIHHSFRSIVKMKGNSIITDMFGHGNFQIFSNVRFHFSFLVMISGL
jgi:hypothetical protein